MSKFYFTQIITDTASEIGEGGLIHKLWIMFGAYVLLANDLAHALNLNFCKHAGTLAL